MVVQTEATPIRLDGEPDPVRLDSISIMAESLTGTLDEVGDYLVRVHEQIAERLGGEWAITEQHNARAPEGHVIGRILMKRTS